MTTAPGAGSQGWKHETGPYERKPDQTVSESSLGLFIKETEAKRMPSSRKVRQKVLQDHHVLRKRNPFRKFGVELAAKLPQESGN